MLNFFKFHRTSRIYPRLEALLTPLSRRGFFRPGRTASVTDTIYALSSGPMVKSGVAVIRLSGPACKDVLEALQTAPSQRHDKNVPRKQDSAHSGDIETFQGKSSTSRSTQSVPLPRMASVRRLYCPKSGEELDRALVLWMPGPRSFTGEDVCELHVHGSRAVILGIFEALTHLDNPQAGRGIRAAESGEFTRRAFDNGRMDLTEVEGLSDLLEADTSMQRIQALRQMDGHLSRKFEQWRQVLVKCLAHTEAVIDFGDDDREDDVDDSAFTALIPVVKELQDEIAGYLRDGRRGELVREGVRIVLVGPPNAGKSSLMNTLARRPAAIVSPTAGTTRDIIEVRMEFGGIPCLVSDTAGLRDGTDDLIEKEGMRRAKECFHRAHIRIFVADSSAESEMVAAQCMFDSLLREEREKGSEYLASDLSRSPGRHTSSSLSSPLSPSPSPSFSANSSPPKMLLVLNKSDLLPSESSASISPAAVGSDREWKPNVPSFSLSCTKGVGLPALEAAIEAHIKSLLETSSDTGSALITRERHRRHLQLCAAHLETFLERRLLLDSAAEELRLAAMELGRVIGRVDVEELLDVIFRDFCIGK
jgi:tRNA modification GTPase